ncbi:MAG TPA: ABC transporter permease [Solirubrobacteraceae bacterium]
MSQPVSTAPIEPAPPAADAALEESLLRRLVRTTPALQIAAVIVLFIVVVATISGFFTLTSIYSTLILASFLGIAACGQTVAILIGAIDLSVPAVISGANLICTLLAGRHWPFGLVIVFVIACSAVIGAINGFTIHHFRVPPLIVTLATGAMVTGATLGVTNDGEVSGQVPSWLGTFSSPIAKTFGIGIPPVIVLWIVVAIVLSIVLHLTVTGHRTYATGANPPAATLAGVKTGRIWIGAFVLSAVGAAVVGMLLTGFTGAGDAGVGTPYLFLTIAAVLVGGTSLVGARGDYWRTVLGALILTLITTFLVGHGAGAATQEILFGVLILAFVGVYGRDQRVRDRV